MLRCRRGTKEKTAGWSRECGRKRELYVLGDVIDRGENNLKMLDFCRLEENVTLLKGNHELFMQRYLEGSPWLREHWKSWGGNTTLRELEQTTEEKKEEYLQ